MYNKPLALLNVLILVAYIVMVWPDGFAAMFTVTVVAGITIFFINRFGEEQKRALLQVFLIALAARLFFGLIVEVYDLRGFFGGDANTYNRIAGKTLEYWIAGGSESDIFNDRDLNRLEGGSRGMYYLVSILYLLVGKNMLAVQAFCGSIGAATAPLVYRCAHKLFGNQRVSTISAYFVALFPAMIVWSGQMLKDGLIVFLLVLSMILILRLQEKFSYGDFIGLSISMLGIITLRFYIFYMLATAVVGAFVVGSTKSRQSLGFRLIVLLLLGLSLTYLGVLRSAERGLQRVNSLQTVQVSRASLARDDSGFGEDLDVSTTQGAIQAIPVGLMYLMLAPFPWQATTLRQSFVLPDVLIWWTSIPFLFVGVFYSLRQKLRESTPIFLFTGMLTFAYSIFQGNVGTAYRQRTQIQVFLFIFVAVGITVFIENRENKRLVRDARRRKMEAAYRERERIRTGGAKTGLT